MGARHIIGKERHAWLCGRARAPSASGARLRLARLMCAAALSSIMLAGCSTAMLEDADFESAEQDCHQPVAMFSTFRMHVLSSQRSDAHGRAPSQVTLTIEFENTTPLPHALSNSGDGYVYHVDVSLARSSGDAIAGHDSQGILDAKQVNTAIDPDKPAKGTVAFEAPKGSYSLTILRKPTGGGAPGLPQDRFAACKITI
jgi:hypothetical protein